MKILEIKIHNYKSLRDISIKPTPLCVLVGPNAAGKSNFSDALDFLGEIYRLGLEVAIARKGGYENICYRHKRRSKAPIYFGIKLQFEKEDIINLSSPQLRRKLYKNSLIFNYGLTISHSFEFKAESTSIKSPFKIVKEELYITPHFELTKFDGSENLKESEVLFYIRENDEIIKSNFPENFNVFSGFVSNNLKNLFSENTKQLPNNQFFLTYFFGIYHRLPFLVNVIGSLRVFQLSPSHCREPGVPTPNPEINRFGENLPAIINFMKNTPRYKKQYAHLFNYVKSVMPDLIDLDVQYTHHKTLGLIFKEKGYGRPWTAEDVSDGTIQMVALLTTIFDPRTSIVVVEEPENSIHPWAIRNFLKAARQASNNKQIILTTHSPILINQLQPEELWIVQRPESITKIDSILNLDSALLEDWKKGLFSLSEYLDSGVIPEAVPGD